MLIPGASFPAPTPAAPKAVDTARRARAPAAAPIPASGALEPEAASALAGAEAVADKSRTARRDALAQELTRLIAVARKLNGAGDLRSSADALQDLARQIAKIARALADAERALPPAERRGLAAAAIPTTPRAEPAAAAAEGDAPEGRSGAATPGAEAAPDDIAVSTSTDVDDPPAGPMERLEERREQRRAGREGTRQLLLAAADLLDEIRKTVRKAELFENLLDPEAARERGKAGKEIEGYALELRGLAGGFADPARGLGFDLTA
jgi:ribonuclease E